MSSDDENILHSNTMSKSSANNKITILNQTLLKAANLMVRRDFLTKVLNDSNNKVDKLVTNQESTNSEDMKIQTTVPKKNTKKKEIYDKQTKNVNHLLECSDSDSSDAQTAKRMKKKNKMKGKKSIPSSDNINYEKSTAEEVQIPTLDLPDDTSGSDTSKESISIEQANNHHKTINVETEIKKETNLSPLRSEEVYQNDDFNNKTKSKITTELNDIESKNTHDRKEEIIQTYATTNEYKKIANDETNLLNMLGNMNEEIYLVQMCKNLDPRLLIDKSVSFDQSTKLKYGHNAYMWSINYNGKNAVNFIDFDNFFHFNLEGIITVHQSFKSKSTSISLESTKNIPNIPDNLKRRHPLFGTKYKNKVKLNENILRRLNASHSENKKYKSKEKIKQGESERVDKKHKKKKRNSHSFSAESTPQRKINDYNDILQDECLEGLDKSIKRKDVGSSFSKDEVQYQLHEKNYGIINSTMSTSKINNTILQLDESLIPKTKKKRRHTHKEALDNFIDDLVKDVTASEEAHSPKKKKHRHSR